MMMTLRSCFIVLAMVSALCDYSGCSGLFILPVRRSQTNQPFENWPDTKQSKWQTFGACRNIWVHSSDATCEFVRKQPPKKSHASLFLNAVLNGPGSSPSKFKKQRSATSTARGAAIALLTIFVAKCQPAWASASNHAAASLGAKNLLSAAAMLGSLAVLPFWSYGLNSIARDLAISACRCALQVFLLGSVLLQQIMGTTYPLYVALWIFGVGLIAGKEAFSRIQYTYPGMKQHIYSSIVSGGLSILSLAFALNVLGDVQPWFQPRTWIPVAGMLFGNTLSASALGASTITKQFATKQDQVELRLARGATSKEATLPLIRETFLTALTPTINGLAVTGIVHIPGMMTGQILAGQSPTQAAAYQIMINFLIATTACATVQLLTRSVVGALVDSKNHRLCSEILTMKESDKAMSISSGFNRIREVFASKKPVKGDHPSKSKPVISSPKYFLTAPKLDHSASTQPEEQPVLEASRLHIHRANVDVDIKCRPGNRIGIKGISGVGKSQVLRTLAGLEESPSGTLKLDGRLTSDISPPEYRTSVCFVSQNKPTLEGTPRQFYDEIMNFHQFKGRETESYHSPTDIVEGWGMPSASFDQLWSTLSGGESQRISLAIALSLQPRVLLLDESTSALDEVTSAIVEQTLKESAIPIVMVSHSNQQLDRFCTHTIDMSY